MTTVEGLPAHVLLVHAVVVLVPLTALLLVVESLWPAARRRLAWPTAVLAVVTLVSVPLATEAGDWLEHRIASTPLVREHAELGDTLLPWAIGLAVLAVLVAARQQWTRRAERRASEAGPAERRPRGRLLSAALAVVAIALAGGSVVSVYRIGDSGARAAWTGQFSATPLPRAGAAPLTPG
jgi:hypothetical protein